MLDKKITRRALGTTFLALLALPLLSETAKAQSAPLGPIVRRLKKRHKAKVIDARLVNVSGVPAYRIKLLTKKKQLVTLFYNANTGKRLK